MGARADAFTLHQYVLKPHKDLGMSTSSDTHTHVFLQRGQIAPGFALPNAEGAVVRLKAFRQRRPVLLAFLHGATCPVCREWLSQLASIRYELSYHDVQPLLIFPDDPATLRALQKELPLPGELLADPDYEVLMRYVRKDAQMAQTSHNPVLLVAVDRYSTCLDAWLADEPSRWPPLADLMATFAFAEQEDCACGLPTWPDA